MWKKFNIKIQLVIFMTLIVVAVEATTLFFILKIQKEENRNNAITQAKAITQSLNNDFLKYILNPNADILSDITFRLSAFKNINGILLFDSENNPIFKYAHSIDLEKNKDSILKNDIIFTNEHLFIKNNIEAQGYSFGYQFMDIDLSSFKEKEKNITLTLLVIFPFALFFGFLISVFLSKNFTNPFIRLLDAMKNSDPTNNKIIKVETTANNEIKELFDGFNNQMDEIYKSSLKLQHQATHDQLTNIYNRFYIENKLQDALKNKTAKGYCLFYIDLDQFKLINDSAGYQAGDELLKMISSTYNNNLPEACTFARVDGDGFMVFYENRSKEEGIKILEKILEEFRDFRFIWANETYSVSASVALIHFNAFEYTLKELLKAINTTLYTAKEKGRNKSHIYDLSDNLTKRFKTELETAKLIKEALKDGPSKFELFAQDIIQLQKQSDKFSYEILIRMWDKDGNFISPGDFLPAAERYQLMAEIDMYVLWTYLETVTKDTKHIENLHSAHINLAGSTLNNPDFQECLKKAINTFDFPWEKLELEVTESSAIGNFNMANEFIKWLKEQKIGLALDDFGTGMASFEYLKSLPFDVIKVDGSFVKDMHKDPVDKAVIKYIQEIAQLKGQETVAEYVETKEDVEELTKIGITYGQGFYLGKPRPLSSWLS
ncbi:EAL domain-containing protein [Campylobacterota bacterium DY0563]